MVLHNTKIMHKMDLSIDIAEKNIIFSANDDKITKRVYMKTQLELEDRHRLIIRKCLMSAGYPAALAKAIGVERQVLYHWENKRLSWDTWIAIVSYARSQGIVGKYYDPITLTDPYPGADLDKEVYEAAWMLQNMIDGPARKKLLDDIAAAYGRQAAQRGYAG